MIVIIGVYPEIKDEESSPDLQFVGILERFYIMDNISIATNKNIKASWRGQCILEWLQDRCGSSEKEGLNIRDFHETEGIGVGN